MASLLSLQCGSEHWLTVMTCTICENTPECSPLYRCSMGHFICGPCFNNLVRKEGAIRCLKCNSKKFRKFFVSADFLRKLKIKPGIGRRRRYRNVDLKKSPSNLSDSFLDEHEQQKDCMTLEKLFQLPRPQIEQMFEATARAKIKSEGKLKPALSHSSRLYFPTLERGDTGTQKKVDICSATELAPKVEASTCLSKKPLVCPHFGCKKLLTLSSFTNHFQHDHSEIPCFTTQRGKVLHLIHDVRVIEFNTIFCLAILNVYEKPKKKSIPAVTGSSDQTFVGTFWLMVSGSVEESKSKSYVLYWLSTNKSEHFSCTIEITSLNDNFTSSTLCGVNKITDNSSVADIAYSLNCLNLCYNSMRNLLQEGPRLHLRVVIH